MADLIVKAAHAQTTELISVLPCDATPVWPRIVAGDVYVLPEDAAKGQRAFRVFTVPPEQIKESTMRIRIDK